MVRPIETSLEQRLPLSTDVALRRRFMVVKEPLPGNVRFGLLLEEVALRHARRTDPQAYVVTAAIDKVALRTPGDVNRDIELKARRAAREGRGTRGERPYAQWPTPMPEP